MEITVASRGERSGSARTRDGDGDVGWLERLAVAAQEVR